MFKAIKLDNNKINTIAILFTLFSLFYETFVLDIKYSESIISDFDENTLFFFSLTIIFFSISLFLYLQFIIYSLKVSSLLKVVCFILFAIANILEFSMQKALGRFSNFLDVETAFATTVEQKTSALIYLNFDALIPIGIFLTLLIITKKESLITLRNTLIYSCVLIISFFVFFLIQEKTINSKIPSISLISFSKTTSDFFHYDSMNNKWVSETVGNRQVRRKINPPQNSIPPVNNIVLVIAESIRGDKLSLNGYQRETTPFLKSLEKNNILHNWGIASSASTGSRFSFSAIVTGLSPDDFPDKTAYSNTISICQIDRI